MREVGFLCVAQVVQEGAGGRGGGWVCIQAESFEAVGPELIEQRAPSCLVFECPRLDARDRQTVRAPSRRIAFRSRPVGATISRGRTTDNLVGERLESSLAGVLGAGKLASRQIEQGSTDKRRVRKGCNPSSGDCRKRGRTPSDP